MICFDSRCNFCVTAADRLQVLARDGRLVCPNNLTCDLTLGPRPPSLTICNGRVAVVVVLVVVVVVVEEEEGWW